MDKLRILFLFLIFSAGCSSGNEPSDNLFFDIIPSPNLQNKWASTKGPNQSNFEAYAVSDSRIFANTGNAVYYIDRANPVEWKLFAYNGKIFDFLPASVLYLTFNQQMLYNETLKKLFAIVSTDDGEILIFVSDDEKEWKLEENIPADMNIAIDSDDEAVYVLSKDSIYKITNQTEKIYSISAYNSDSKNLTIDPIDETLYVSNDNRIIKIDKNVENIFLEPSTQVEIIKYSPTTETLYGLGSGALFADKHALIHGGMDYPSWDVITGTNFPLMALSGDGLYLASDVDDIFSAKRIYHEDIHDGDNFFSESDYTLEPICGSIVDKVVKSISIGKVIVLPDINFLGAKDNKIYFGDYFGISVCENEKTIYGLTEKGISESDIGALDFSSGKLIAQTSYDPPPDGIESNSYYSSFSMDSSNNWQGISEIGLMTPVTSISSSNVSFNIVEGEGIKISYDGKTWESFNDGLPDLRVNAIAYDSDKKILYVGTSGNGVYQRLLE